MNGTHTYANTAFPPLPPVTIEWLCELVEEQEKKRREVDAVMAQALRHHIIRSHETLQTWAQRLGVPSAELFDVLYQAKPISWHLWENIRRVFGPCGGT